MKKIYALIILASLAVGCSKSNDDIDPQTDTEIKKENPSAPVPAASITAVKSGNIRTVTITGSFYDFYFDQIYHKADGSLPGSKETIRTAYRLEYDKAVLFSNGKIAFTFIRTGAYTYTLTHTILPEDYETNRITLRGNNTNLEKEY